MTRTRSINLHNCHDCNLLETEDGYADHIYHCPLLGRVTSKVTDVESAEAASKELTEWFEKDCPLPKEPKVFNLQFEKHQLEVLEKIKNIMVSWQNYEAASHVREAIKSLKEKLEVPKDESTTTVYKLEKGPGEHEDVSLKT